MTKELKIHCIEMKKDNFDEIPFEELRKMVGWIEPDIEHNSWDVTMADGCGFSCKDQATAQLLASMEEVKALLMKVANTHIITKDGCEE